ncbi:helix-turn-helix domain-containing protein [Streptomyces sp. NPDC013157]|uniref:helix-turn-helix domain-containing protein n=1 Tax=Streptomyces sp. NPDC013157 TaxID=3364861 RepID=UPI0036825BE7
MPSAVPSTGRSGQHVLFLRISAFIVEHLGDPDLGPETIAAAHQISLRYLHRVCQQQATTPMAFIRQQRLDRCRRDLANAALSHLTIHAVATRWGYPPSRTGSPAPSGRRWGCRRASTGWPCGRLRRRGRQQVRRRVLDEYRMGAP